MDYLIKLHKELYPHDNNCLRNDEKTRILIEDQLKNLNIIINSDLSKREKINYIVHTSAAILLLQPFYDGNSHTAKLFLTRMLEKIDIYLDYNVIKDTKILPLYYSVNETGNNNANKIHKLINRN